MKRDKRYVIFDLDGTLVDSFDTIVKCCVEVMRSHGLDMGHCGYDSFERYRRADLGVLFETCAQKINISITDFKATFDKIYDQNPIEGTSTINSTMDILLNMRCEGFGIIVLTNKRQHIAQKVCDSLLGKYNIDFVIGRLNENPLKPFHEIITRMASLGITPSQCVAYYGDSEVDQVSANLLDINYNQIHY